MKNKIKLKDASKLFQNEIKGYGIKVQLSREQMDKSKNFEDLNFEVLFSYLTKVLPGTKLSVNGGIEEFFENLEEDFDDEQ